MSVLAFKAISYGAEKIPDKFFERIPGGFFTPSEKKKIDKKRSDNRRRSEERHREHTRRRSHRDRTPPTDYSDQSGYEDSDYDEYSTKHRHRRRARSLGRSLSRSLSRGRNRDRSHTGDLYRDMDRAERAPEFPPPAAEYRPYDPQEYAPAAAATGAAVANAYYDQRDRRESSSVRPDYGYPPQPLGPRGSLSSSAAKYTPAGAYAQTPAATPVPQPVPQPVPVYAPYNPADYAAPSPANRAPVAYYPSPPPFYRQQSRSQPSLEQYPVAYIEAPSRHGSTASASHRRQGDGKHHRTRSAGHHGRSRSRVTDKFRDRYDNLDSHEKTLAASVGGALAGGLAGNALGHGALSTIVGAAIGGLGAREFEKKHEKQKASREPSLALQPLAASRSRHSSGRRDDSRSPSQDRRRTDRFNTSDSDSDSDSHGRAARRRGSSRRRDADY